MDIYNLIDLKGEMIYETSYGFNIPTKMILSKPFGGIVSSKICSDKYNANILDYFLDNGFILLCKDEHITKRETSLEKILLFNGDLGIELTRSSNTNDVFYTLSYYYSAKNTKQLSDIFDESKIISYLRGKKTISNISIITNESGFYELKDFTFKLKDIDFEMNYGAAFLPIHEHILLNLNKENGTGIVLLHGLPGTGKTTYLRHLTKLIEEKEIIFLPPGMANALADPSFVPFLMEHKNSILIMEDGESIIRDREQAPQEPATSVSNLLNLTDGILGDCLNIQVIVTFNMNRSKIDKALLRSGRLIAEHEFDELTPVETNKLIEHLNIDYKSPKGMVLCDIYNLNKEPIRNKKNKEKTKIGFTS